jgi:hypothetical protein
MIWASGRAFPARPVRRALQSFCKEAAKRIFTTIADAGFYEQ